MSSSGERYRSGGLYCSWCSKPLGEGRKGTFCTDECEHEYKVRTSKSYARRKVFERDGGVCALCGMDTVAEQKRLESLEREDPEAYVIQRQTLEIPDHRVTLWDMDHIVPVVEGGGECGMDNYRTLCIWCHKEITGDLLRHLPRNRDSGGREGFDPESETERGKSVLCRDEAPQLERGSDVVVIHVLSKPSTSGSELDQTDRSKHLRPDWPLDL